MQQYEITIEMCIDGEDGEFLIVYEREDFEYPSCSDIIAVHPSRIDADGSSTEYDLNVNLKDKIGKQEESIRDKIASRDHVAEDMARERENRLDRWYDR